MAVDLQIDKDQFERLMGGLGSKHHSDALKGRVFSQTTTPLGVAIPIYTSVTPLGNALWNPAGSGVDVELINYNASRVSGVEAFGAIGLMARKVAQSAIATGSQITAFAETTPVNGMIGGGQASRVKSSNAGTCTITAGVAAEYVRNLFAMLPVIDTTAAESPLKEVDFDGTVIVEPGVLVWVAATVASVALFAQTLTWKELPR